MSTSLRASCFVLVLAACAPVPTPGMAPSAVRAHREDPSLDELARAEPAADHRALLVAYPKDGCSGSARVVFVDREGRFHGALAPGDAALLDVPASTKRLVAISSVEIEAPVETWHVSEIVDVPAAPNGLIVRSARVDGRRCWRSGQYASVSPATKSDLEELLGDHDMTWLTPRLAEGQAWLDRHRPRVAAILAAR